MPEEYSQNSYDAVLSRMEQKLDTIVENVDVIKKSHADLDKRVSNLEFFKYYLTGMMAIITIGANYLMTKLKGES